MSKVNLFDDKSPLTLIARLYFTQTEQHSQSFLEAKEQERRLQRIRDKKSIPALLAIIQNSLEQAAVLYKNVRRLSFVLAVSTPNAKLNI